ncbi:hypothetical protein NA57DRAFT_74884 [Rhizodiscina lignyota]|uniref:Uncharacterized protein n=1 Tax=Rhizodiscina lignyota TaxID=1504668 RepID=A0A9P4IHH4_9PEZI|nr:hypothetical protein NA57DRAFT_74884 [Rhizodiscina lignyota]
MPSPDAGRVITYFEAVAILAQLLHSGNSLNYNKIEAVTGDKVAGVYLRRMKTLVRDAKMISDDWKNGGSGRLSDLIENELSRNTSGVDATAPAAAPVQRSSKTRKSLAPAGKRVNIKKVKKENDENVEGENREEVEVEEETMDWLDLEEGYSI